MSEAAWLDKRGRAFWVVFAIWLETAIVALIMHRAQYSAMWFNDPDDAMRLLQVRDFLAGQSWFDVSQHRANPPYGSPMHWSRLVDMPIAAIISVLKPLVGNYWAELTALIIVPLATLAILFRVTFAATLHFMGRSGAMMCCLLLATSPMILVQLPPLRVDHHAWQIVMVAIALGGMVMPDPRKGGWITGAAIAMDLHISSEGLPVAAFAGLALGVRYILDAREWSRLLRYIWTLLGCSVLLLLITHGWAASLISYCDGISPVYLAPLGMVALGLTLARPALGDGTMLRRAGPALIGGILGAALFLKVGGPCLRGPFATMDPIVYDFWYVNVLEGRPLWVQEPGVGGSLLLISLLGLIGSLLALRYETSHRQAWLTIVIMAAGTLLVGCVVTRANSVAHLVALPGGAWIILQLRSRIADFKLMILRVLATASLCVLSPVGLAAVVISVIDKETYARNDKSDVLSHLDPRDMQKLAKMPPSFILTTLDIGPDILLRTRHSVLGTGHHRNVDGIAKVLRTFLSSPDAAKSVVLSTQATYLLLPLKMNETGTYIKTRPRGLAAQLNAGRAPNWLEPVDLGLKTARLYRIKRAAPLSRR